MSIYLETERLILCEYEYSDFDALKAIISDKEIMSHFPSPYDDEGVKHWISWSRKGYLTYGYGFLAVILKSSGQLIGNAGITPQNIHGVIRPEIGYHFNKAYWHQGYASEASHALKRWGFVTFNFEALFSYMDKDNLPSIAVAKRNGMHLVDSYFDHGEDLLVYSISIKEFINQK